jgi:hypothetical protein
MLAVLVSVALSQAAATAPATAHSVPGVPVDVVAPTQPRRICRIERDTSSRISGRRVCQTAHERDQERDASQRSAADGVNRQSDRQWGDQFGQDPNRLGPMSVGSTTGVNPR